MMNVGQTIKDNAVKMLMASKEVLKARLFIFQSEVSHHYASSGKLTKLKHALPEICQTIGTLHWNAAARKEPTPHKQMTKPRALPITFNSCMGANARRNRTIDILARIVVSIKRRSEA